MVFAYIVLKNKMNHLALKEEFAVKEDICVQWVDKIDQIKNEDRLDTEWKV